MARWEPWEHGGNSSSWALSTFMWQEQRGWEARPGRTGVILCNTSTAAPNWQTGPFPEGRREGRGETKNLIFQCACASVIFLPTHTQGNPVLFSPLYFSSVGFTVHVSHLLTQGNLSGFFLRLPRSLHILERITLSKYAQLYIIPKLIFYCFFYV